MISSTTLVAFVLILWAHFVGDFVLQTDWQAKNKSKRWDAMLPHVATYTMTLAVAAAWMFGTAGLGYALVNGAAHLLTDVVTSQGTAHYAAKKDWHRFFVVVGADQLVHQATLALTLALML